MAGEARLEGSLVTETEKGAPALTTLGVMARMLANKDRGGSLVAINGQCIGPRGTAAKFIFPPPQPAEGQDQAAATAAAAASAAAAGGTSRAKLRELVDLALAEGQHCDSLAEQVADLWVLTFETGAVRDGKGERRVFLYLFMALAEHFPETAVAMLPLVPQFASWNMLSFIHVQAERDIAELAPESDKAVALRQLQRGVEDVYFAQLQHDAGILQQAASAAGGTTGAAPPAVPGAATAPPSADKPASEAAAGTGTGSDQAAQARRSLSLAGKWAPSVGLAVDKHSGLGKTLALRLNPWKGQGAASEAHVKWARQKYRQLLTQLRSALDVPEVKMAGKRWRELRPTAVPSKANTKYRRAFMNQARPGTEGVEVGDAVVRSTDEDRVLCAEHFQAAIQATLDGTATKRIKGSASEPQALTKPYMFGGQEDPMLEAQWVDMRKSLMEKGVMPPALCMVDVSGSMGGLPMEVSIALGILLSQILPEPWHGRFLTFESTPQWVDISACTSLYDAVKQTQAAPWGGSTNFALALRSILETATQEGLSNDAVPKVLFVFSDMQFDAADRSGTGDAVFRLGSEDIRDGFKAKGYAVPHIVFWNLRATGTPSFQADASTPGVSIMSGYSQQCMADFLDTGVLKSGQEVTP